MDEKLAFRRAAATDFAAVLNLACQLASHIEADAPALSPRQFEQFYLASGAPMQLLLAVAGTRVLGMVSWILTHELYSAEARAYISDLVIDPSARGRGVGAALMGEVAARAGAKGAVKLGWEVWRHNATAKAFYARIGGHVDDEALPYVMRMEGAR